ncbi:MAG: 4Fe-4S dicluster domain-containing protein [Candidatus Omnitrophica bacterium]|nr:4Fe-4S dicluster domain-containing protein [Candidatus Omnitrophota bacterium]
MSNDNLIETDVLVIGGGPAGLAFAIHYADLSKKNNLPIKVMILEKAAVLGNHTLSGAVMNLKNISQLLPDVDLTTIPTQTPVQQEEILFLTKKNAFALPFHPKAMSNKGNHILSLGAMVRWLGQIAEQKGVEIFAGVAGHEPIFENGKLVGVFTGASGLDHEGKPMANYQPPTEVRAKIIILAEGSRGHLTKKLIEKYSLAQDKNPQVYSLGVKEVWEVPEGAFLQGRVCHTLGFPLSSDQFGGGFVYGFSKTQVVIGFCSGLDYSNPAFDPHGALQMYKTHPRIAGIIKNGKLIKYGAKNIPEGGLFSLPKLYHDNFMLIGDAAGMVAMPSLKGIHLGIKAGMTAAQAAFEAIKAQDTSKETLSLYEKLFKDTPEYRELYASRNFRQCFTSNLYFGFLKFGINLITGGRGLSLSGKSKLEADYKHCETASKDNHLPKVAFDNKMLFDKEADLFFSGTKHNEEQPCHILISSRDTCVDCIERFEAPCQHFCPAQVFELSRDAQTNKGKIILHPSNCVHCKTCDIKDPFQNVTWVPPYGADGPQYDNM